MAGSLAHSDAAYVAETKERMNPVQKFKNRILTGLPKSEIARLTPHLSPLDLDQGMSLIEAKAPYGYFLEEGIASVVVTLKNGNTVEVGIIGLEGVVGLPILLGTEGAPGRTFMQIGGSGYRIPAKALKTEFEQPGQFRASLLRCLQAFHVQAAQTAACNRLHGIEERLARWLLSCRDRMTTDQLRLTHDFLAQMLGAPRTTVTLAAGLLHRAGLIDYSRGLVTIKDRGGLEGSACECYFTVRDEFQRLSLL